MIISASRRTDIPNYYSEWFLNRIKEGFVCVRNPMNIHRVSRIPLSPDVVDCIVFWTKNPANMLDKLDQLKGYQYYFQFTVTPYGKDIERNIPDKNEVVIPVFKKLSDIIGAERVIWRYDPIFFSNKYTHEYHLRAFRRIAEALNGRTKKCVISFVDIYRKNKKNMEQSGAVVPADNDLIRFCKQLKEIADENHIELATCAEKIDLSSIGIKHNSCIDKNVIETLLRCKLKTKKDPNQREECKCVESIDIGAYNTCMNLCSYCYANFSIDTVLKNQLEHDVNSPLLCGQLSEEDHVYDREVSSLKINFEQLNLWDV